MGMYESARRYAPGALLVGSQLQRREAIERFRLLGFLGTFNSSMQQPGRVWSFLWKSCKSPCFLQDSRSTNSPSRAPLALWSPASVHEAACADSAGVLELATKDVLASRDIAAAECVE